MFQDALDSYVSLPQRNYLPRKLFFLLTYVYMLLKVITMRIYMFS